MRLLNRLSLPVIACLPRVDLVAGRASFTSPGTLQVIRVSSTASSTMTSAAETFKETMPTGPAPSCRRVRKGNLRVLMYRPSAGPCAGAARVERVW